MARVEAGRYVETGRWPHWKAAIQAGLIAGLVFLVLEMLMVAAFLFQSPWAPPRMIAAIVLGRDVLPPPASFDLGIVLVALAVHFVLSILLALVLALLIYRVNLATALLTGTLLGLGVYLVNFYIFTAAFPWFAEARNWVTIFAHIVFGLTLAWSYKALTRREIEHTVRA